MELSLEHHNSLVSQRFQSVPSPMYSLYFLVYKPINSLSFPSWFGWFLEPESCPEIDFGKFYKIFPLYCFPLFFPSIIKEGTWVVYIYIQTLFTLIYTYTYISTKYTHSRFRRRANPRGRRDWKRGHGEREIEDTSHFFLPSTLHPTHTYTHFYI